MCDNGPCPAQRTWQQLGGWHGIADELAGGRNLRLDLLLLRHDVIIGYPLPKFAHCEASVASWRARGNKVSAATYTYDDRIARLSGVARSAGHPAWHGFSLRALSRLLRSRHVASRLFIARARDHSAPYT